MKNMVQMEPKRTTELLTQLQASLDNILGKMQMDDINDFTPVHHLHDVEHIGIDNAGIEIMTNVDTKGREWFCVGHMVYDAGVRYHSDGSGTPPSEDFEEDIFVKADDVLAASAEILKFVFSFHLAETIGHIHEGQLVDEINDEANLLDG